LAADSLATTMPMLLKTSPRVGPGCPKRMHPARALRRWRAGPTERRSGEGRDDGSPCRTGRSSGSAVPVRTAGKKATKQSGEDRRGRSKRLLGATHRGDGKQGRGPSRFPGGPDEVQVGSFRGSSPQSAIRRKLHLLSLSRGAVQNRTSKGSS